MVFVGYSGFLHYLQLASHELATFGINVTKNEIQKKTSDVSSPSFPLLFSPLPSSALLSFWLLSPSFFSPPSLCGSVWFSPPSSSSEGLAQGLGWGWGLDCSVLSRPPPLPHPPPSRSRSRAYMSGQYCGGFTILTAALLLAGQLPSSPLLSEL